jgi:hypothetical protein
MTYKYTNKRRNTYDVVKSMLLEDSIALFSEWLSAQLETMLRSINSYMDRDADALAELIPTLLHELFSET